MAINDSIKRLQLGESLEKIVRNADDNFVSLFDTVYDLNENVTNIVQASEAMIFKGTLGTGGTVTSLPTTHSAGDTYKVITAGTYAGKECKVGDLIICVKDSTDTSDIDTHWTVYEGNPDGTVTSSSTSSVNERVAIFDGSSGKIIKDSGFTIKKSVPADAKFTDTTYDPATTSKAGLMSATDKAKLNGIAEGANKYVLPNAGATLGGVKSGGDVTIQDGVITVTSVGGKTADEIGKVKDVTVNGSTVLGTDGVANITIDDLKAGYVSVSSSSLVDCVVGDTTYKAIKVVDTDTPLEVYNYPAGNKILTHTVRKDGYLYICVGTTAIECTLRKINGNSVSGGGTVDSEGFRNAKWIEIEDNSDIQHKYINKLPLNGKPSLLLVGFYDTASSSKPIRTLKFFIPSLQNLGKSVGTIYIADDDPATINNQKIDVFEMSFNDSNTSASLYKTSNFSNTWYIYSIILVRFD